MCPSAQCPCLAIREVVSWDIIKDCHCHHVVIIKCHRSNIKLEHFVIVHIMIATTICDLSSVLVTVVGLLLIRRKIYVLAQKLIKVVFHQTDFISFIVLLIVPYQSHFAILML